MRDLAKEQVRDELLERVRKELFGPNAETEELDEAPSQRYLCGVLWPSGLTVDASDDEDFAAGQEGEESSGPEVTAPLGQAMRPSSIGMSFLVDGQCQQLRVTGRWGMYIPLQVEGVVRHHWLRNPMTEETVIDLIPDGLRKEHRRHDCPGASIEWLTRPLGDRLAVSLFLVNRHTKPESGGSDAVCLFQPRLEVTGLEEGARPFVVRSLAATDAIRPDVRQDNLLFRHHREFAVGHGSAVQWDQVAAARDRVGRLSTVAIPDQAVAKVIPPSWDREGSLDMQVLADAADGEAIRDYLYPLTQAYADWIEERQQETLALPDDLQSQADEHLKLCLESLKRIRTGLNMIVTRPEVFAAFRFANRAMAWQRTQAKWAQQARKSGDWSTGPKPVTSVWRPFQIAFILQALTSVVESTHGDRGLADLLWFPTGGGKTEAYLGLSAFTMALRRLRKEQGGLRGDAGVTVIMRYTLRLLTIQQFQRAASLICAMELLRQQEEDSWGKEPFRIGLWVGSGSTPNDFDAARKALEPQNNGNGATPVQLVACPWCGHKLTAKNYLANPRTRRITVNCGRKDCDFNVTRNKEGIPALVEDEEIYRLAPGLLIGTVDKFARIAWAPETQALFGRVRGQIPGWGFAVDGEGLDTATWRKQALASQGLQESIADGHGLLPPDLIIQDELHLISGPLGTMVGLYETAIDALCSREVDGQVVGPKVVASTATIRQAERQVQALFSRRAHIFPPPGLEAGDSFFAQEQPLEQESGRLYVGVFAPGRSVKTALVRLYAALLASTGAIAADPKDVDPYYTLVGYFNSLRELGGAVRLVEDDVRARMRLLAKTGRLGQQFQFVERKLRDQVDELTSRINSDKIPLLLDKLDRVFDGSPRPAEPPLDLVLASNMISVGVDVSRLGLMVVTGQPKTTAEYIQATSRVGREHPGIVFTVYNWVRPRDLSHYERFGHYHATLYRHVEPLSVTPFSARARDRALAGTFIALCRQRVQGLAGRGDAVKFKAGDAAVQLLRDHLLRRVDNVGQSWRRPEVQQELDNVIERWNKAASKGALPYSGREKHVTPVMYPLGHQKKDGLFGVPNSMRDVEVPVGLYLVTGEGNEQ